MKVDYLIVGQGLAGTLLANEFIRRKKTFLVIDNPGQQKASNVAAGLINPVVFRRMTKSWMVDEAFPVMEVVYKELEELLQTKIYYPCQMFRILESQEHDVWREKVKSNQLEKYLEPEPVIDSFGINLPFSKKIGRVKIAGRVDVVNLINDFAIYLKSNKLIRYQEFEYKRIKFDSGEVVYDDINASKIIFCEGAAVVYNPFFKELKFKHSKGEVLDLAIEDLYLKNILSKEIFIMPSHDNIYKVGATYTWDNLNQSTTISARDELLNKLSKIISCNPILVDQKAGIRPTMHDRKPVIGLLPEQSEIGIFNGLGSKGALLGPYFARQLSNYLCDRSTDILKEAHIKRYF